MDRGMDTGDMIAVRRTPIRADETYGELQDRLAVIAGEMAAEWMPRIVAGDYPREAQDPGLATMAPKVQKSEAELSFDRPAIEEYARFRAFTPSPGAVLKTSFGLIRVSRARSSELGARNSGSEALSNSEFRAPSSELPGPRSAIPDPRSQMSGTILSMSPSLVISFAEGAMELIEVQPEGKKRMSGRDLANGLRLKPGMNLKPTL